MNVKSILKNTIKKGPVKTYQIYKKRKEEKAEELRKIELKREEKAKKLRKIQLKQDVIEKIAEGSFDDAREVLGEYLKMISSKKDVSGSLQSHYISCTWT